MRKWPEVSLGNHVDFIGGGTPSRDRPDYWGGNIPWASVKDLRNIYIDDTIESITDAGLKNSAANFIPENTVIIASRVGLGKVAINRIPIAINQDLKALKPRGKDLLPRFLLFFFMTQAGELEKAGVGATVKGLTIADYQRLKLHLPPLPEQQRIVKLLDEADELRKLREQADKRSADLIPALFEEMFGDPAKNPKGWPIKNTGELMSECDYGTSQKANEEGKGICVLRMGNVTIDGQLDLASLKTVELSPSDLNKQLLKDGDVLFNRTNSRDLVGKTGMWDGRFEAVAASYFIRLRFRADNEHPQHFTTFMNLPFMKQRLAEIARGAVGQANINSKELKSIPMPVPPISLQQKFAARVSELRDLESAQSASRKNLDALFQSMLHRAFEGEL
jgi:type I restriction enzyme S subunit